MLHHNSQNFLSPVAATLGIAKIFIELNVIFWHDLQLSLV